jgi:hypothetical protein
VISNQWPGSGEEELSPERKEAIIEAVARRVLQMRLSTPAVLFLEMHKPLTFLASQAVTFVSPVFAVFFGFERMKEMATFLRKRENIEALVERIEELGG